MIFPSKWLSKIRYQFLTGIRNRLNPFIIYSPLVKDGLGLDPEGNGYGGAVASTATGTSICAEPHHYSQFK